MATDRIDVHNHIIPKEYLAGLERAGISTTGGIAYPEWSPQIAMDVMDRVGTRVAITSVSSPGVVFAEAKVARELARQLNDVSARLITDYPDRFGAFGHIPLPDVDSALLELEYLSDSLHLDGVILLASIGERYLGDAAFEPVFAELNRRKTVVFVHPTIHPSTKAVPLDLPEFLLEFTFDTTRAIANLVFSGTLERYPDIRFIFAHGGGTVPYLAWRMSIAKMIDSRLGDLIPEDPETYLKRLYYDTALSPSSQAMGAMTQLVDPSHILFGSDWPMAPEAITERTIASLQGLDVIDAATLKDIETTNAYALFPRFKV